MPRLPLALCSRGLPALLVCLGLGLSSPALADDVNCNGIPREQEKDRLAPSSDCVHFVANGNNCTRNVSAPTRKCDDYLSTTPGMSATCSAMLAPDGDGDGWGDACDNCPMRSNSDQADKDNDGIGDSCDNCPTIPNHDQQDSKRDGIGDACRGCPGSGYVGIDSDGDGRPDICDNCVRVGNADQADQDHDGVGDSCDNCRSAHNADQKDSDGDGIGDLCDNCPAVANADQIPSVHFGRDGLLLGIACDADTGCSAAAVPTSTSGYAALLAMLAVALGWSRRRSRL